MPESPEMTIALAAYNGVCLLGENGEAPLDVATVTAPVELCGAVLFRLPLNGKEYVVRVQELA